MMKPGVTDGFGALSQGQVGTITSDDRDEQPYKVRSASGSTFRSKATQYFRESEVQCPTTNSGGSSAGM